MKKIITLSVLFLAIICLVYIKLDRKQNTPPIVAPPTPPKQLTPDEAREVISEKDCKENLEFLAADELEGRMSGKKGNVEAANYIKKELEEYGLKTLFHKFKISRVNPGPKDETGDDFTQNVYAWIDGGELKDQIVVVGAHFDHIGYGPKYSRSKKVAIHNGADDNASGTVAVLEIAKAMSKLKPNRTIVFQFYSGEEMGLIGSKFYCDNPLFPQGSPDLKKHVAMINLDMVGHLERNPTYARDSVFNLKEEIKQLSSKYPFALKVISTGGGSDHVPFNNKGIPNVFIHTGSHKYYHTPEDDVPTVNISGIVDVSKFVFDLTWKLANENIPQKAIFKELPLDKDHDENEFN